MPIKIDKSKDGMGVEVFKAKFDDWEGEWQHNEKYAIETLINKIVDENKLLKELGKSDRETLIEISKFFHPIG